MIFTTKLFALALAAASTQAIPLPNPQTPDPETLKPCPKDGYIVCDPDGVSFYMCNFGKAVPMGAVAAGMTCRNGEMIARDGSTVTFELPMPSTAASTVKAEPTIPVKVDSTSMSPEPTESPIYPSARPVPEEPTTTITTTVEVPTGTTTSVLFTTVTIGEPMQTSEIILTVDVTTSTVTSTEYTTVITTSPPSTATGSEPVPTISITEDVILKVAPNAVTCSGAEVPDECGTAKEAAPFISEAFKKYGIETIGEAAAILSLMVFESVEFKYNQNHFPGRPGQGTKAMLMPNFIVSYAQTFGSTDSIKPGITPENINDQDDDIKRKVLATVQGDDRTYASAAWFYSTFCGDSVKAKLKETPVTLAAWSSYITECINTSADPARQPSFEAAVKALGGPTPM